MRVALFDLRLEGVVIRRSHALDLVVIRGKRRVFLRKKHHGLNQLEAVKRRQRLVLVRQVRQVSGSRRDVGHFQNQVLRKFMLDSEAPLLDARCFQIWIDGELRWGPDRLGGVFENLIDDRRRPFADVLDRNRGAAREIKPWIRVHRGIKDACSAAEHGLIMAPGRRPGKPNSW